MRVYWVNCAGGSYHLFGHCPKCEAGLFILTSSIHETGIVLGKCLECKAEQAFYVRPADHKVWTLAEPAEVVIYKE